jgi:hypothetical protein
VCQHWLQWTTAAGVGIKINVGGVGCVDDIIGDVGIIGEGVASIDDAVTVLAVNVKGYKGALVTIVVVDMVGIQVWDVLLVLVLAWVTSLSSHNVLSLVLRLLLPGLGSMQAGCVPV